MGWIICIAKCSVFSIRHQLLFLFYHQNYIDKIDKNNATIEIYAKQNENWITFKMKDRYLLELSTLATQKLLGISELEDKNGENIQKSKVV